MIGLGLSLTQQSNGALGADYALTSSAPAALTYSRAGSAYAQTVAGDLTLFAADAPRITDKGLLIEAAATNLIPRNTAFDDAGWSKVNATVTANALTAPDGTATGDSVVSANATATMRVQRAITVVAGQTYFLSCLFHSDGVPWVGLRTAEQTGVPVAFFDVLNGALGNIETGWANGRIESLSGGWKRCSASLVADTTTITVRPLLSGGNTQTTFTGDGIKSLGHWGMQLELDRLSSPIITAAASATRAADVASMAVPLNCRNYIVDHDGGQATGTVTPGGALDLATGPWVGGYIQRVRFTP